MFKNLKQIIPELKISDARLEIENNYKNFKSDCTKILDSYEPNGFRTAKIYRVMHEDILNLKKLLEVMFYPDLLDHIKSLFDQVYIVNNFYCTINGYSNVRHRDGQSMGFNKKALLASKKIFKVIIYLNDNDKSEGGGISLCPVNSNPIEIFKEEKLFTKINYYIENYIKKKIIIRVNNKIGDVLLMDSNVWHSATPRKKIYNQNEVSKIYTAYEFVTDREVAEFYSSHIKNEYKIKTSNDNFPKELLNLLTLKKINLIPL